MIAVWFMVVIGNFGYTHGATAQVGPFETEQQCETAAAKITRATIRVQTVCVQGARSR